MIRRIIPNLISIPFRLIPRNKRIWVTGKISSWEYDNDPPAFFDNSKYFFLYLVTQTTERVYWLSSSDKEIEMLHDMNLPVVRFPSIKGILVVLRAKFSFHHYGPNQIDMALQRGMIQLDFWHGTPLKKIRYDVVGKPLASKNLYFDIMSKGGIEYISSTSEYLSKKILAGAFAAEQDRFLNYGYPRTDILKLDRESNLAFCKKYSRELLPYIERAERYSKVFLYMPTFRDDDPEYIAKANIDFELLNEKLKSINGIFFIKLHPLTKYLSFKQFDNIIQISNDVDIYPFLQYVDYLITDYSSIYFDYLLLDREIIFIPYDYEKYVSKRELYFKYEDITPGKKYYSFQQFICDIVNVDKLDNRERRKKVLDLLVKDYHFDACEKIYNFIKKKY